MGAINYDVHHQRITAVDEQLLGSKLPVLTKLIYQTRSAKTQKFPQLLLARLRK